MIKTHIIWNDGQLYPADIVEINATVQTMTAAGKTDGSYSQFDNPGNPTQRIIERHWTDVAAANEWITYILTFNPVAAEIVE